MLQVFRTMNFIWAPSGSSTTAGRAPTATTDRRCRAAPGRRAPQRARPRRSTACARCARARLHRVCTACARSAASAADRPRPAEPAQLGPAARRRRARARRRDRHSDNILVASDGTLFHIDWHILDAVALDTGAFATTRDFKAVLEAAGAGSRGDVLLLATAKHYDMPRDRDDDACCDRAGREDPRGAPPLAARRRARRAARASSCARWSRAGRFDEDAAKNGALRLAVTPSPGRG